MVAEGALQHQTTAALVHYSLQTNSVFYLWLYLKHLEFQLQKEKNGNVWKNLVFIKYLECGATRSYLAQFGKVHAVAVRSENVSLPGQLAEICLRCNALCS